MTQSYHKAKTTRTRKQQTQKDARVLLFHATSKQSGALTRKVVSRKPAQRKSDVAKKRSSPQALARDPGSFTTANKSDETVNKSDACEVPVWTLINVNQEKAAAMVRAWAHTSDSKSRASGDRARRDRLPSGSEWPVEPQDKGENPRAWNNRPDITKSAYPGGWATRQPSATCSK